MGKVDHRTDSYDLKTTTLFVVIVVVFSFSTRIIISVIKLSLHRIKIYAVYFKVILPVCLHTDRFGFLTCFQINVQHTNFTWLYDKCTAYTFLLVLR